MDQTSCSHQNSRVERMFFLAETTTGPIFHPLTEIQINEILFHHHECVCNRVGVPSSSRLVGYLVHRLEGPICRILSVKPVYSHSFSAPSEAPQLVLTLNTIFTNCWCLDLQNIKQIDLSWLIAWLWWKTHTPLVCPKMWPLQNNFQSKFQNSSLVQFCGLTSYLYGARSHDFPTHLSIPVISNHSFFPSKRTYPSCSFHITLSVFIQT